MFIVTTLLQIFRRMQ